MIAYKNIIPHR